MNRADVEQEVVSILRQCALHGSERAVALDKPLGQVGLGLDSLALLEFVTAVERRFDVAFSDDIWTRRGQLALTDVVDEIVGRGAPVALVAASVVQRPRELAQGRAARALALVREQGLFKGSMSIASRAFKRAIGHVYWRDDLAIMSCPLTDLPVLGDLCALPLEFGVRRDMRSLGDLADFWPPRRRRERTELFEERFRREYLCFTASHEGRIVGLDWISAGGDDELGTGLRFKEGQGACYGLDLEEHQLFGGKGVGLALLAFSLEECRRRGFTLQVTLVATGNVKMISASTTFFGFRQAGTVTVRRVLSRPHSKWVLGQRSGGGEIPYP